MFDEEGLADVREIQVVVEGGGGPDLPGLDTPVFEEWTEHAVRFLSLLEIQSDVLQETGLVAFS